MRATYGRVHGGSGDPKVVSPEYHLRRARLLDQLSLARVALVVAGGGYGKSLLAAALAAELGIASAHVTLGPGDSDEAALVARVIAALARGRLVDSATAVRAVRASPALAMDELANALSRERGPVLVALDDAHFLGPGAAGLVAAFGEQLPPGHRLLVLARHLPAAFGHLAAQAVTMHAGELAFSTEEVAQLARLSGLELSTIDAEALCRATAGWAAAVRLAIASVVRSAQPEAELTAVLCQQKPLRYIVTRQLSHLEHPSRDHFVQLAHLPRVSPEVAEAVAGDKYLLDRAASAGLPLSVRPDGWWELPAPVQELVCRHAALLPATARAAARVYAMAGELADALYVLMRAGQADDAAALLAGISPQEADDLGYMELQTLLDALPDRAVQRHGAGLLHLARACEPAAQTRLRAATLERAASAAHLSADTALERAVRAEMARDLARDGRPGEAEALAEELLLQVGPEELATRARLLDVLGRTAAWRREPALLARAERLLREAHALCRRLGLRSWANQVVLPLGNGVYFTQARYQQAAECLETGLAELPSRSRHRGIILCFLADVLVDWGRFADAEAAVEEGRRLGALLNDRRLRAYALWSAANLASAMGDARRTLAELRAAEDERDDWFVHSTGATFLADAADLLDRVGEREASLAYLERARARRDESPIDFAIAEAAVLARSGPPAEAARCLAAAAQMPRLQARERWRLTLLTAYAQARGHDPRAGATAALAFQQAAELGHPSLPFVRERALAENLAGLVAAAGAVAGGELAFPHGPLAVSVLGRFELRRAGGLVKLPPGKPAQLVKLLAVSGGRLLSEAAIEALWPEVEPHSGRKRLRNTLNRLRAAGADLIVRDGDVLVLGSSDVDAYDFEQEARAALDGREAGAAGRALSRYHGPLLPDDLYEEWAAAPRERLRRLFVAVADAAAAAAEAGGDVDEALRCVERALELEPHDEARYLQGAKLLLDQGRRGAALALLSRGERALGELGVLPSAAHSKLVGTARDRR